MPQSREKLKVAFLGGGVNSAVGGVHKIALEMDGHFELVAGCFSKNRETNQSSGRKYGVPPDRIHPNLATLLQQEHSRLDAIIILTPTPQHKSEVIQCLNRHFPVICEKALAATSQDIRQVLQHQRNDSFLAVIYNYTGYPMVKEMKHLIASGKIGPLQQLNIEMPQEGYSRLDNHGHPIPPQAWRLRDGAVPTLYLDLGVHVHILAKYLASATPQAVHTINNTYGHFPNLVDNTLTTAQYTDGITCNFWFSKSALGHRNGLRIRAYGQIGSMEWIQSNPETLMLFDNQGSQSLLDRASPDAVAATQPPFSRFKPGHPAGFIEAFANYYHNVAESLRSHQQQGSQPPSENVFGTECALEGLLLLEAMEQSARHSTKTNLQPAQQDDKRRHPNV